MTGVMQNQLILLSAVSLIGFGSCASSGSHANAAASTNHCGRVDGRAVGLSQSPINISSKDLGSRGHQIAFEFHPSQEHIVHKATTIELEYDEGSSVAFDGSTYELRQFHFHTPSEHLVDGVTYPLECHLVHLGTEPDTYLVIGVLFKEGRKSEFLEAFLGDVPSRAGQHFDGSQVIDVRELLAGDFDAYTYQGSLTTPPYTESVRWLVLKTVREATREQIQRLHLLEGDNARHIQPLAGRSVEAG